ncbi:MAG: hypothetical protein PF542_02545 [Nanoarchaeota archaeon]|jgi:hypothetical protein|nr:hypothetical protein [Nanoarchaeota archaeon]
MKRISRNIIMWLKEPTEGLNTNFINKKSKAYHKFFNKINKRDNFRFGYGLNSYEGKGIFNNVAIYKNNKIIRTKEKFKADVIYQYSSIAPIGLKTKPAIMTNSSEFREFCIKINAYNYMPQFFPRTFLVKTKKEMTEAIKKIATDKVVLKPNYGKNGEDVNIFEKSRINLNLIPLNKLHSGGFLVQEFIDTSKGIPKIAKSHHDLRIITHGNKISLCHIRQPQTGSLIGNSHKGASIKEIQIDKIPKFILNFYKEVHKKIIKKYPNPLYSMDLGVGDDGPKLIELNSHTAFPGDNFKCMNIFIDNLIEHLENIK